MLKTEIRGLSPLSPLNNDHPIRFSVALRTTVPHSTRRSYSMIKQKPSHYTLPTKLSHRRDATCSYLGQRRAAITAVLSARTAVLSSSTDTEVGQRIRVASLSEDVSV